MAQNKFEGLKVLPSGAVVSTCNIGFLAMEINIVIQERRCAVQALPINRLRHMNPLSIEFYRRYKVD